MRNSLWFKAGLPLIIIVIAMVVAGVMIKSRKPPEQKPAETKAFLVDAKPATYEEVQFTVSSQGNVLPKNQTQISAQVGGRIVSVADVFVAGGLFNKGDVLLTLEADDYETDLKLAEAELAQAQAALQEEIARGKVAEEEWRSVKSVVPPELGLRKPQLAKEQANVKAAQAKMERAKRNLERTKIRAPYNGLVVTRDVDVGQYIATGKVVGTVYSTDVAEVRLPITDSDLAFINLSRNLDNAASVDMTAIVAGKRRHWQGKLVRTEGVLDSGNRVVYAVAEVNDPYLRASAEEGTVLRYGQFVEASITGAESQSLIVLPRSVLRLDNTILTVNDDRELRIKPVTVVRTDSENVYLSDGIAAGELVVRSAVPNPYNGLKVRLPGEDDGMPEPAKNDKQDDTESVATDEATE